MKLCEREQCKDEFEPKSSRHRFCSSKCRTAESMKKWLKSGLCKYCDTAIKPTASTCKKCMNLDKQNELKEMTLGTYLERTKGRGKDRYNGIRQLARSWLKDSSSGVCKKCSYDKHTELAHIKPIVEFPMETTLAEINDESNLLELCRNCHWELDHGLFGWKDVK